MITTYNLQITITDIGYQIDFINPQKYNENFMELENKGIIEGSMCRDYGVNIIKTNKTIQRWMINYTYQ